MKIYCASLKEGEQISDLSLLAREDFKIFKLIISQKEGEVALAKILTASCESIFFEKIVLIYEDHEQKHHLLFQGYSLGFPRQISQDLAEIELTAEPRDSFSQLEKLSHSLKVAPFYDPLFIEPFDNNPVNVLEGRSDLFHWCRQTGELSLSNIFKGKRNLNLSDSLFADTLKITLGEVPFSEIKVELKAEWIQQASGEFNIFPKIAHQFSHSTINTLTPNQLVHTWPKVGERIGLEGTQKKSGYYVTRSTLKLISPSITGSLNLYPALSPAFKVSSHAEAVRLKRSWFKGELWLGWEYKQKRVEKVHFTLKNDFQLKSKIRYRQKNLKIPLQSVEGFLPSLNCASFFQTDRGKEAVQHGIEIAKAYLAGASRCIETEFQVPFEQGFTINLDDSVILKGDFIPGKSMEGKVTEYRFEITDREQIVWVKLGTSLGKKDGDQNISFNDFNHQIPLKGLTDPEKLNVENFVKNINIQGDALDQINHLSSSEKNLLGDIKNLLREKPALIHVDLLELRSSGAEDHTINVSLNQEWSSPCQIQIY